MNRRQEIEAARGWTINELAKILRVSPDKIRGWIRSGNLKAINIASTLAGKPRFVILPKHLEEFEQTRTTGPPPKTIRKKRKPKGYIDFYPD